MSQYVIETAVEREPTGVRLEEIQNAAQCALEHMDVDKAAGLTILLTDDQTLQSLNRRHTGYDEPTDVLSFQMDEHIPGMDAYLGDIAISVESARRQAELVGHSLKAELQTLTVHAVLHLLGYDHADPSGKALMWQEQAAILSKLGSDIVVPTELDSD